MSVADTQATMDAYFDVVRRRGDFTRFYADDVTWHMVDSADVVVGVDQVRDYVTAFRRKIVIQDQPYGLSVSDGKAYLEATAVNRTPDAKGLDYILVYDVRDGRITGIRCYGSAAALMLV
jgi:ketosteroid isomerase-like protein